MNLPLCSTGCEAPSAVEGCIKGWAEFTCNKTAQKSQQGKAKYKARFLWYSDDKNGHFKLFIENLTQKDPGEYACKYDNGRIHAVQLELQSGKSPT